MANLPLPLLLYSLIFLFSLAFAVATTNLRNPIRSGAGAGTGDLWCVAKNNAEDAALQAALDWACGPGSADCRPVQTGGPCFEPEDLESHASYAFNDYFLRHGSSPSACDFSGSAAITGVNPSHGECKFPASLYSSNGSFSGSSTGFGLANAGINGSLGWSLTLFATILTTYFVSCNVFR